MILAIIQARLKSTRLPKKVLLKVQGKTVLEHIYNRVSFSKADKVVIAIPKDDDKLEKLCIREKMNYFLGSELDVLDRYYQCAKKYGADSIIRITADCPVIDYKIINECIDTFMKSDIDYLNNSWIGKETYPDGMDCAIITFEYLKFIHDSIERLHIYLHESMTNKIKEHVLIYPMLNLKEFCKDNFKKEILNYSKNLSNYRLTLDYPEDWELIKILYNHLYKAKNNWYFGMKEIINFLKKYSEFVKINSMYVRNEGYRR